MSVPLSIGTVVVRDADSARFRLVGTFGRSWSAERLDEGKFAIVRLTPRSLAAFHVEGEEDDVDARTPQVRQDAGEPAFAADGERLHPLTDGAWQLAEWEEEHARKQAAGEWALADAFFAREAAIHRAAQAEEDAYQAQLDAQIFDEA